MQRLNEQRVFQPFNKEDSESRLRLPLILILFAYGLIATGCAHTPASSSTIGSSQSSLGKQVSTYATSLMGTPYRYGGASPEKGFDCSGLVHHVYARHGIALPRSSSAMAQALPTIGQKDLSEGDLVFFSTTPGKPYSHVGLYLGNGKFIHAPSAKTGKVHISSLQEGYFKQRFSGGRRVLD